MADIDIDVAVTLPDDAIVIVEPLQLIDTPLLDVPDDVYSLPSR